MANSFLDAATLYEGLTFPPGSDVRPHLAVNMISTADGKAAVGGRAAPIGSPSDRVVMRRLRAAADCVLVGAGTIRAEAFDIRVGPAEQTAREARGQAAQPLAAILTNTGDLPIGRRALFRGREPRPLVFTSERAVRAYPERFARLREVVTVVPVGVETPDLPSLLAALARDFGARRVLVEGGPALNQALFAADLVDELFLTIAPRVVGGRSKTIVEADFESTLDLARLALVSVAAAADGEVFLRYRVARGEDDEVAEVDPEWVPGRMRSGDECVSMPPERAEGERRASPNCPEQVSRERMRCMPSPASPSTSPQSSTLPH